MKGRQCLDRALGAETITSCKRKPNNRKHINTSKPCQPKQPTNFSTHLARSHLSHCKIIKEPYIKETEAR